MFGGVLRAQLDEFRTRGCCLGHERRYFNSAVVCALLARALGPEKVLVLLLPERDSSPQSKVNTLLEIKRLGVAYHGNQPHPHPGSNRHLQTGTLTFPGHPADQGKRCPTATPLNGRGDRRVAITRRALGTRHLGSHRQVLNSGYAFRVPNTVCVWCCCITSPSRKTVW